MVEVCDVGRIYKRKYAIVKDLDENEMPVSDTHKTMEIFDEDESMQTVSVRRIAEDILEDIKNSCD